MSGYFVVDTGGNLTHQGLDPTLDRLDAAVGPEGWARVRLADEFGLCGFVNDCGLLMPERYPRNPVGACLLAAYGASQNPYAGPVVITGWDPDPYGDDIEVRPLSEGQQVAIPNVHSMVRRVLAGSDELSGSADLRAYAEHVRGAATPPIVVRSAGSLRELFEQTEGES